ncbi:uncharacterized protein LOC112137866 [Oryzias melastigma]|uniref:uncharacterized protein LOC112137866 n=1 Tax=Oryzias melastigma TaxID=30732 RepID=UPI000CF809A9|nr:uncharacterized protein LOC112137866 [Oryzias melastigma]
MTQSLDFLLDQRGKDNDVLDSNEYVFAAQNSNSYLRGSDCLRKFAAASGARRPETLTSTHLRKHVATLSQIMNLKENELDQLAKFMGHDIRVHREYYRLTENTLQLAKMSNLLLAIEHGTEAYKGKSLDEINLSFERCSEEVGLEQKSEFGKESDEDGDVLTQPLPPPRPKKRKKTGSSNREWEKAPDLDDGNVLTEKQPTPQ